VIVDSDQNRPQADGANPPPAASAAEPGQDFSSEPDFSGFQADVRESLLPRWLHLSLLWLLGLGAAAALVMAGMFVTQERKTDKTLELLAASSRGDLAAPVVPAVQPAAAIGQKKATDLVLLPSPAVAETPAAQAAAPATPASISPPETEVTSAVADTVPVAAPAKPKPVAKKKKPKPAQATALAQRGDSQTWQPERDESETWRPQRRESQEVQPEPRESQASQPERRERQRGSRQRGESITEKLNAAVAACRARPHAPGECNLRACDILGNSDPACR
jgi:hypothetical protein